MTDAVITEYTLLPEDADIDDLGARPFMLRVQYRGNDRFIILRSDGFCMSRAGHWHYELAGAQTRSDWLADHRFLLTEALELAYAAIEKLDVDGQTWKCAHRRGVASA